MISCLSCILVGILNIKYGAEKEEYDFTRYINYTIAAFCFVITITYLCLKFK